MQGVCWIACAVGLLACFGCERAGRPLGAVPPNRPLLEAPAPVPDWWQGRPDQARALLRRTVRRGELRVLSRSPGGRPVQVVCYGKAEPHLRGKANFNSAVAAREPDAYFRRAPGARKRPVLVILAGTHGQEMEGMVAALSAVSVVETGKDLAGRARPELRDTLRRLRLIVIPMANPDGRARCPYDGWVGLPTEEMTRYGQGTRTDGTLYGWPGCKAVHPMRGDVGIFGAYFDDAGVNLMHDEWHDPMSTTTKALLRLVAEEGPDLLLNLHGHAAPPAVLQTAYAPVSVKEQITAFARSYYAELKARSIRHGRVPRVAPDGPAGQCPPALNLTSMCYHAGAAVPITHESPQGLHDAPTAFDYATILDAHHALFAAAADWLLSAGKSE